MAFHRLFVYGTLKRGQPNYKQFDSEYGVAKYIGQARTVKKWPLVIASQCNVPFLLDSENIGNHVTGEIFDVDDKMLQHCDELERCHEIYQRTTIQVQLTEDSEGSEVTGDVEDVFVYVLQGYKDFMLELPHYECYDSNVSHGLVYVPKSKRNKDFQLHLEVLKEKF